jgi:site-specific recombinase XerD
MAAEAPFTFCRVSVPKSQALASGRIMASDELIIQTETRTRRNGSDAISLTPALVEGESLKRMIENYLVYYASGHGHTARAKRYDLVHFLQFVAGSPSQIDSTPVSAWTMQATQNFVDHRLAIGESPATVARRLATIKHLGRTLAERVPGYINPAREVKGPVLAVTRPKGLSAEEISLLREAAQPSEIEFSAVRNQFLLELLMATGLRADEVRTLVVGQISDDREWLKNVKTKGRKYRSVYLDSAVRGLLLSYLELREAELSKRFPLFSSLSTSERTMFPVLNGFYRVDLSRPATLGLSSKSIWRIISEFGKRAQALSTSPSLNLHPHKLRHTFAHGLLDTSKDVRLVAQALGHSDVRTTMRYTERTAEEIKRAIEQKVSQGR